MRSTKDLAGRSVWVAMSGGVDSSFAAALMIDAGACVSGVTMRLAEEGVDTTHDAAIVAAADVCAFLGIPHSTMDMTSEFATVVASARQSRAAGLTPNPCVACNEKLKFGEFFTRCQGSGADLIATGHYVRTTPDSDGNLRLARGHDATKDQSYFLYRLGPAVLDSSVFPLGDWLKEDVSQHAALRSLPVLEAESQDICIPSLFAAVDSGRSGEIVDASGNVLATHSDVTAFTVGQRKGLGIGGGTPYFVTGVDVDSGIVSVGERDCVDRRTVEAVDAVWWSPRADTDCTAQIRYRGVATPGHARFDGGALRVTFDDPVDAPAPGQSVVCYENGVVLGGGIIESAS